MAGRERKNTFFRGCSLFIGGGGSEDVRGHEFLFGNIRGLRNFFQNFGGHKIFFGIFWGHEIIFSTFYM